MKAMVRDDIVKLETFVAIRFKFEEWIRMIDDCGGYVFLEQFNEHFGENRAKYILKQLQDYNLIKTNYYSNYKFCYLSDVSLKYLQYADDERDFSDIDKNRIYSKNISPKPSDKVLFSSAIKFALMQEEDNKNLVSKTSFEKLTRDVFAEMYKINDLKIIKNELEDAEKKLHELELSKKYIERILELLDSNYDPSALKQINIKIKELEEQLRNKQLFKKSLQEDISKLDIQREKLQIEDSIYRKKKAIYDNINSNYKKAIDIRHDKEKKYAKAIEENKIIEERIEKAVKKTIDFYDKSKIILLISQDLLEIIIIDSGVLKKLQGYIDIINEYSAFVQCDFKEVSIVLASYSLKRNNEVIDKFKKDFRNAKRLGQRKYEFCHTSKAFYIEKIKDSDLKGNLDYVKKTDVDRFQELYNTLNN